MEKIKKIKNIEKSKFYKKITKKIQGDKVKFWEFQIAMEEVEFTCEDSYKMKHRYNFKKVIRGKNEIKWHILQKVINDVNERYNKLKTRSNQITFYLLYNMQAIVCCMPLSAGFAAASPCFATALRQPS